MTAGVSVVAHASSNEMVTASNPAAAGEMLTLFATGLGPTVPGVDPGQPFPSSPPAVVNSPVEVVVNGQAADVIRAVGVPRLVDTCAVTFRVPSGTAKGEATVYVAAAWIAGPKVTFTVQ